MNVPKTRLNKDTKHTLLGHMESEFDARILRQHYAEKGLAFCANKLPEHSKASIYGQAHALGLKRKGKDQKKSRTREEFAALDARISEMWPTLEIPKGDRSGVKEIARRLGEPHWVIVQRCLRLGLTISRTKEPKWTPAEDELMKHVPLHDANKSSEIFHAHGFRRTPTAIMVRAKRINLSRRNKEGFTARSAALVIGWDNKTVSEYCLKGLIKSTRRKTQRLPQRGGDPHSIQRADLRQFVIDNLELIDFRKVDKFAIVDLLANCQAAAPLVNSPTN